MTAAGVAFAVAALAGLGTALPAEALPGVPGLSACSVSSMGPGAPYYAVELVPTGRVPGTRRARGAATISYAHSPFGLSVTPDGEYVYDLHVEFSGLPSTSGDFVVWVTKADLSEVNAVGRLDGEQKIEARVDWNKFLVVVTLEAATEPLGETWNGPIVFRGMSRSGRMHTMAGHGPFQAEPCSKYGY